jgi:hypothetical protein
MLPNFVVIGAQKASSTFVQEALSDHPDVYMPDGEIPFFEDPDYQHLSLVDLENLCGDRTEQKALGIKRPSYLNRPEVPHRLARDLPGVRLIAVLRNPVERAVSSYFHYMKYGFIPVRAVSDGLRDLLAGRYDAKYPRAHEVLTYGLYHQGLERYSACFDRQQMHILLHEDIRADGAKAVRSCYQFLGIDADYNPSTLDSRPMAATYSLPRLRLGALFQPTYMRIDPDGLRAHLRRGPFAAAFRNFFVGLDRYFWSRIFVEHKPTLDPELRKKLVEYYRNDIVALEAMLERDLGRWLSH